MAILGYLPTLKSGLELAFGAHFQYYFSIKEFLNTLSIDKVQFYIFLSFSRYYLDNCWRRKCHFGSSSKPMTDGEKKRGRRKYESLNILTMKRAFQMK